MLQKFFKNKNTSKKLNLRLKNTIIDKVLTYASETWTLTKRDRKQLNFMVTPCINNTEPFLLPTDAHNVKKRRVIKTF